MTVLAAKTELYIMIIRNILLMSVKKLIWLGGLEVFQRTGLLLPQARHYAPCAIFATTSIVVTMYLGATRDWTSFALFLISDWTAFITRMWAFTELG